ncbi:hypothetical protein OJF2_61300 [Aquisphaera giovannonii]|uniref:Uncharacterized protein n=1 Tax=Aquisphaera giovannonii TaxID=406548 RepID=A0A5B9WB98_9BACT|nr:hypothetical protein [Aquisphaera giovannonii]QEH37539.1 hypothetical protein OJF2_61300 [Aquisphaera giovannonii]
MAGKARKNPVLANPFFAALLVASTLFVVTALGYLVAPSAMKPRPVEAGAASRALAAWLDRRGPLLLGLEFGVMLATGVLAMVTEDWFMGRGGGSPPRRD